MYNAKYGPGLEHKLSRILFFSFMFFVLAPVIAWYQLLIPAPYVHYRN
jgi:hypothetical protein